MFCLSITYTDTYPGYLSAAEVSIIVMFLSSKMLIKVIVTFLVNQ